MMIVSGKASFDVTIITLGVPDLIRNAKICDIKPITYKNTPESYDSGVNLFVQNFPPPMFRLPLLLPPLLPLLVVPEELSRGLCMRLVVR